MGEADEKTRPCPEYRQSGVRLAMKVGPWRRAVAFLAPLRSLRQARRAGLGRRTGANILQRPFHLGRMRGQVRVELYRTLAQPSQRPAQRKTPACSKGAR